METATLITWIINSISLLCLTYMFVYPLQRMDDRRIVNLLICSIGCIFSAASDFILWNTCAFFSGVSAAYLLKLVIDSLIVLLCVFAMFRQRCLDVIYCSVWPLMTTYTVDIFSEIIKGFFKAPYNTIIQSILHVTLCVLISLILYRPLPRNGRYDSGPKRTVSAVFILLLSQYISFLYHMQTSPQILLLVFELYCITFLFLQAEMFKKSEMTNELNMLEQLWHQQKKQYEITKDQMQIIDRKCHDLKYQVAAMKHIDNPDEREKNLNELEQSISIYDSLVKTGNAILDTLLSEKGLLCEARGITLNCVIDGEKLGFIDSIDLYSLFGNALDNAIEAVSSYEDNEHKFIDICVTEKRGFIYIRISNPIEQTLSYNGDLPETTKGDKLYHGIGLKSIRHLTEKYNGHMTITTENGCFVLEVLLQK